MPTNLFAAGAYSAAQNLTAVAGAKPAAPTGAAGSDFGALLRGAIEGVASTGQKAETQALSAVSGKGDLVDVVTAVAESEAALDTLVAVRDRVIAAYEEIMRMPI